MCGIVLTINASTSANWGITNFFKDALMASQLRGTHATGLFQKDSNGIDVFKKACNATDFVSLARAESILNYAKNQTFTVGHVRHATQGSKDSDANAHPFVIERDDGSKLVGVHNGSLVGWAGKSKGEHSVDSHWAMQMLVDEGADAFEHFNGPYCFVWHDTNNPDILNIARNKERPFHLAMDKNKKTLYGASEGGMLEWILERRDIMKVDEMTVYELEVGLIYSINVNTLEITTSHTPTYKAPAYQSTGSHHRTYDYDDNELYSRYYWRNWIDNDTTYEYTPASDYTNRNLEEIGKALNPPRQSTDTQDFEVNWNSDLIDPDDKLPFDVNDSLKAEGQVWALASNVITAKHVPSDKVKAGQRKMAQDAKTLGQLVCWEPLVYDDDSPIGELVGEVHYLHQGQRMKIDGILQHIRKTRANNSYLSGSLMTVHPMMIIGMDLYDDGTPYVIIGELSSTERKLLIPNTTLSIA